MHQYQYKVVPAPTVVETKGTPATYFEELINRETQGGWEYVGMEQITQSTGCMFSKKQYQHNMLIFKR